MTTKEELEKENEQLRATVESLAIELNRERQHAQMREYEMLKRIYPYMANELDMLREELARTKQEG